MGVLGIIANDQEIQNLRKIIHDSTGVWEGILFWDGETIEAYRERLKSQVEALKDKGKLQP